MIDQLTLFQFPDLTTTALPCLKELGVWTMQQSWTMEHLLLRVDQFHNGPIKCPDVIWDIAIVFHCTHLFCQFLFSPCNQQIFGIGIKSCKFFWDTHFPSCRKQNTRTHATYIETNTPTQSKLNDETTSSSCSIKGFRGNWEDLSCLVGLCNLKWLLYCQTISVMIIQAQSKLRI